MSKHFAHGYEMGLLATKLDAKNNKRVDYSKVPSKFHMRAHNGECNTLYSMCYTCEYYNRTYHIDSGDYSHNEIHYILMEILTSVNPEFVEKKSVKPEFIKKKSVKITKLKRTRNRDGNKKNMINSPDQKTLLEATFKINKSPTKKQVLVLLKKLLLLGHDDTGMIIKLKKHTETTVTWWFNNQRMKLKKNVCC
jgi:hypothetical protein